MFKKPILIALSSLFIGASLSAQDDDLFEGMDEEDEKQKVIATFKSTSLINGQTNETVKKKQLDFRITHRFGNVASNSGGAHTLFGLDAASNIRFSFDYGITDKLQVGIGRSKTNEHIDGSIKYKIFEQEVDGFPLSIVAFGNVGLIPREAIGNEFPDFATRLSYTSQIIFARKFNWRLSAAIQPTYLHRNIVGYEVNPTNGSQDQNDLFAVGALARFKLTHSFAIIAEYYHTFSEYRTDNTDIPYHMPFGVGVEIETGGHVFQMNFTNASGIIYNDFIPSSGESWADGAFKMGFTISRMFSFNKE